MSPQADYIVSNGTGAAVRSDINGQLAAIVSNNSGATEPATMYAYQWWADTTAGLLKIRNAANNAWITLRELDGTLLMEDGTAAAPGLSFASDPDSGIFRGGANEFGIATNGVERVEFGTSEVVFNDDGANYDFRIEGDTNTSLFFVDASAEAVGIGTASPGDYDAGGNKLVIADTTNSGITIRGGTTGQGAIYFADGTTGNEAFRGRIEYSHSSDSLNFGTAGTGSKVTLDSSGRLLVGTSSALSTTWGGSGSFQISSNSFAVSQVYSFNSVGGDGYGSYFELNRARGTQASPTVVNSGDGLGEINFSGYDGSSFIRGATIKALVDGTPGTNDMPGRIVLATTADGASSPTERMRIASNGLTDLYSTTSTFRIRTGLTGTGGQLLGGFEGASSTSTGTQRIAIYANGNIQNTNNSYGSLSDVKLKENIVDANSQWADLKAIQVRNYNFIEGEAQTQIGVVAQEVETVSPGLVYESPDLDNDGNDLGTTTKSVHYSVLYMKAVKALQEAMERIEQLESKVAALESA
jgi:hypothetical protein